MKDKENGCFLKALQDTSLENGLEWSIQANLFSYKKDIWDDAKYLTT